MKGHDGYVHPSLHHQGAHSHVHTRPEQVYGSVRQRCSATSAALFTEQDDGGQREFLKQRRSSLVYQR